MNRDPHLETTVHRAVDELTGLAQDVADNGELVGTIEDHVRRLRAIAEDLARALLANATQPAENPSSARRSRAPADHDQPS